VFPIGAAFMGLRTPGRNYAPLVSPVGIDDRDLQTIDHADGIYALFAIVEPVIRSFNRRVFEDPQGIFERDGVKSDVPTVLLFIPSVLYVFTQRKYAKSCSLG
jgi:hypothetical protein